MNKYIWFSFSKEISLLTDIYISRFSCERHEECRKAFLFFYFNQFIWNEHYCLKQFIEYWTGTQVSTFAPMFGFYYFLLGLYHAALSKLLISSAWNNSLLFMFFGCYIVVFLFSNFSISIQVFYKLLLSGFFQWRVGVMICF